MVRRTNHEQHQQHRKTTTIKTLRHAIPVFIAAGVIVGVNGFELLGGLLVGAGLLCIVGTISVLTK